MLQLYYANKYSHWPFHCVSMPRPVRIRAGTIRLCWWQNLLHIPERERVERWLAEMGKWRKSWLHWKVDNWTCLPVRSPVSYNQMSFSLQTCLPTSSPIHLGQPNQFRQDALFFLIIFRSTQSYYTTVRNSTKRTCSKHCGEQIQPQ